MKTIKLAVDVLEFSVYIGTGADVLDDVAGKLVALVVENSHEVPLGF